VVARHGRQVLFNIKPPARAQVLARLSALAQSKAEVQAQVLALV
jgi:hypothetical protein